jgi:hypothetical protein
VGALASSGHPARSSAAGSTVAVAAPAAGVCGPSGLPALAYETIGTATTPSSDVEVQCGTGAPRSLGDSENGTAPMAWSPDGTQLAWLTHRAFAVAQFTAGTWAVRTWQCQGCAGVAFLGGQAVSVSADAAGGQQAPAQPQLLVFPRSGSGDPAALPVTGIPAGGQGTGFSLVGSTSPTDVVVDYGNAGGSRPGNAQLLYRVNPAGQATQFGNGTIDQLAPTPGTIFGNVTDFTASPAGREFAFNTYSPDTSFCGGEIDRLQLLDTTTGTVTTPPVPAGGGPSGFWVLSTWFDRAGTPYASVVPNLSDCSTSNIEAGNSIPIVCTLEGGAWVKTGTGVSRAAYGPGNWLAELTGPMDGYGPSRTLTITGGTTPATITDVSAFAWAP